jgi:hypothetical protein
MEAHAGTIRIPTQTETKPRRRRVRLLELLREISQANRERTIQRHHAQVHSVAGSDHTHLINRPRGF